MCVCRWEIDVWIACEGSKKKEEKRSPNLFSSITDTIAVCEKRDAAFVCHTNEHTGSERRQISFILTFGFKKTNPTTTDEDEERCLRQTRKDGPIHGSR